MSLVHAKVENTWGRGSNGYPVYLENCLRTDGLYPYLFGDHKDFVILYHQGYYLCLLLGIFYDLLRTVRKKQWDSYVFQLTFLVAWFYFICYEKQAPSIRSHFACTAVSGGKRCGAMGRGCSF